MKRTVLIGMVGLAAVLCFATLASAAVTTITLYPEDVPDEELPRGVEGDAPDGWGTSSWQGPESGKSNIHVRYLLDGDLLSALFGEETAANLTVADIASISYYTKRPDGTEETHDWWIQIYTRTDGVDDEKSWYGYKFTNNYNDHDETDEWTQYTAMVPEENEADTSNMTFSLTGGSEMTFSEMIDLYGDEFIEMISIQTDSGWNGFDGQVDGLVITLADGTVGRVDLAASSAVPEPATLAIWGVFGGLGLIATRRRRRVA